MRFTVEGTFEQIMDFIGHTALKPPDFVIPDGSISEYGYGEKIFRRIQEKLMKDQESANKKDSVLPEIAPGASLGDRKPDHHLDVHGGVD